MVKIAIRLPRVALAIAELQDRKFDDARDRLLHLAENYHDDPYLRLSVAYYLIDVAKDSATAKQSLTNYLESHAVPENDPLRKALREAGEYLTSALER